VLPSKVPHFLQFVKLSSGKLACRLGRAVSRAHADTLLTRFPPADALVCAYWRRGSVRFAA
jgi:hypothetical protein